MQMFVLNVSQEEEEEEEQMVSCIQQKHCGISFRALDSHLNDSGFESHSVRLLLNK